MSNQKYMTFKQAAGILGLPYFKIQRAVKRGELPAYQLYNSRKLVLIDEIEQIMRRGKTTNHDDDKSADSN